MYTTEGENPAGKCSGGPSGKCAEGMPSSDTQKEAKGPTAKVNGVGMVRPTVNDSTARFSTKDPLGVSTLLVQGNRDHSWEKTPRNGNATHVEYRVSEGEDSLAKASPSRVPKGQLETQESQLGLNSPAPATCQARNSLDEDPFDALVAREGSPLDDDTII